MNLRETSRPHHSRHVRCTLCGTVLPPGGCASRTAPTARCDCPPSRPPSRVGCDLRDVRRVLSTAWLSRGLSHTFSTCVIHHQSGDDGEYDNRKRSCRPIIVKQVAARKDSVPGSS